MIKRRHFLKIGSAAGVGLVLPWGASMPKAYADVLAAGLLDPALQPKFENEVPNPLHPSFYYIPKNWSQNRYNIGMFPITQDLGLVGTNGQSKMTDLWGYGDRRSTASYPGKTFLAFKGNPTRVRWSNNLVKGGKPVKHLLPVDESLHWAYSLHGYTQYSIAKDGVPVVPHLHGGHTETNSDGNPEYFFSPGWNVKGPRWVKKNYMYHNDQEAATLWYHDHGLGITRLNVYAGLAGFYILRDHRDTGFFFNPLKLPAFPYEGAFVFQDKMFRENPNTGKIDLFWPAFPGDPAWEDFITGEGLNDDEVPQPSALAEFFGDHIIVNGVAWPKMEVEPRNYRIRLLNGCDSRFMVLQLREAASTTSTDLDGAGPPIKIHQIGCDVGLLPKPVEVDQIVMAPAERLDLIIDFSKFQGKRLILSNIGPDAPFGGDIPADPGDLYPSRHTDKIMAFDVSKPKSWIPDRFDPNRSLRWDKGFKVKDNPGKQTKVRKLALFEGLDEYGRLQPALGAIDPMLPDDFTGSLPIHQPTNGSMTWHQDITENPGLDDVEIWEVYNVTGDAHPLHVHLVAFEILNRQAFNEDALTVVQKPQAQHNSIPGDLSTYGVGSKITLDEPNLFTGQPVMPPESNEKGGPKDTAVMYPGTVTRLKMKFDRPGRYVYHCHILSHEDHEMMRPYHVGLIPSTTRKAEVLEDFTAENYPNPFHSQTVIKFSLPEPGEAGIRIFDMQGRWVNNLAFDSYEIGEHQIKWDGKNNRGMNVAAGMYTYQLIFNKEAVATGKMQKIN